MNNETRRLPVLDDVLGIENKITSQIRKISQDFDERTSKHIFLIEYWDRGNGDLRTTPGLVLRQRTDGQKSSLRTPVSPPNRSFHGDIGRIDPEPMTNNGIGYNRKYAVDQRAMIRTIEWLQSMMVLGS